MGLKEQLAALREGLQGVEGGSSALEQLGQLEQALQPYEGLDPQAARDALQQAERFNGVNNQLSTLQTERDQLQQQVGKLGDRAQQAELQLDVYRGLNSAGLRPEFEELVLPFAQRSLSRDEQGNLIAGDRSAGEFFGGLKERFPQAFHAEGDAAGTGGAAAGGQPAEQGPTRVQAQNGIVSGVDPNDVLTGKVQIGG
ncbi:MAG: hypothetical protein F6K04_01355 [Leptolyngbya sp. SIO4C5]|nr:hypothetical protein [Leptolyngbya sp. SIO4C5]